MVRILVVDDDKNTRLFLRAVLEEAGYTVVTACDGEEALAVMDREHVDLVVLDTDKEWTVDPERFHSSARNTPFGGWHVTGRPLATVIGSKLAFSRINKED